MDTKNPALLTEAEKNLQAWREVGRRLLKGIVFFAVVAVFCYGIYHLVTWLDKIGYSQEAAYLLLAVIAAGVLGLSLWGYKERVYGQLYGNTKTGAWKVNTGVAPTYPTVNIERQDGSIQWKVKSADLDWSLEIENPIKSFMEKV